MLALVNIGDVPQMTLCGMCPKPGHCCKNIYLTKQSNGEPPTYWADTWEEDARARMTEYGYPFLPGRIVHTYTSDEGREYVTINYDCPKLTDAGLCSIYEDRPKLCRQFVPESSPLCVFGRTTPSFGNLANQF